RPPRSGPFVCGPRSLRDCLCHLVCEQGAKRPGVPVKWLPESDPVPLPGRSGQCGHQCRGCADGILPVQWSARQFFRRSPWQGRDAVEFSHSKRLSSSADPRVGRASSSRLSNSDHGKSKATKALPEATSTYCLPSISYVMGFASVSVPPTENSHNNLPVRASTAKKLPSSVPEKTRPPAVASVLTCAGARKRYSHF